jgi:hypothetical protein
MFEHCLIDTKSYNSVTLLSLSLSTGLYVSSESTSSIVSVSPLAPFWQLLQLQSSEHFKLAFLQEQRLLMQPVLHLQLTKSSTESGAGGKVIHVDLPKSLTRDRA